MAEALATHRPASQLMRELMRDFVQRQREAREYGDFLRAKVDQARDQVRAGNLVGERSRGPLCRPSGAVARGNG